MRRLVIGIDYGTSNSGVAYALFETDDLISNPNVDIWVIKEFARGGTARDGSEKVPSDIALNWKGEPLGYGFDIPKGALPLQWVKLLLEPNGLKQKEKSMSRAWRAYEALPRGKTPVGVVADYLRWLWGKTKASVIDKMDEPDLFETAELTIVLTVPASWSDLAKQRLKAAATMAGMPEASLRLVPEPEAAAIFGLKFQAQKKAIGKGDCVIVCDAGGGTVDLVAYRVRSRVPLSIEQVTSSSGAFCGSAFIDTEFQNQLGSILGARFDKLSATAKAGIEDDFEYRIKRTYNPKRPKLYTISVPGIDDCDHPYIRDGTMDIEDAVLNTAFDSIMPSIMTLFDEQMAQLEVMEPSERPKGILMVGGLSKSDYIHSRVRQAFSGNPDTKVWRADDPWTAVVQGAVACETSPIIHSRLSPDNYGVPYIDGDERKVQWLVRKAHPVMSNTPTKPYGLRIDDEQWLDEDEYCRIEVALVRSAENDVSDEYGTHVKPHAIIDCRVPTRIRHSGKAKLVQEVPKKAWHIPATLVLFFDGAIISFRCVIEGEEVGVAEVSYFHDEDTNTSEEDLDSISIGVVSNATPQADAEGMTAFDLLESPTSRRRRFSSGLFSLTKRDMPRRPPGSMPGRYNRGWIPREDYHRR